MPSDPPPRLSAKSLIILRQIAAGQSYSRIVDSNPEINYHDIFFAAEEAVWLDERIEIARARPPENEASLRPTDLSAMERAKQIYPKAYAPWSADDDEQLGRMFAWSVPLKNWTGNKLDLEPHFRHLIRKGGTP